MPRQLPTHFSIFPASRKRQTILLETVEYFKKNKESIIKSAQANHQRWKSQNAKSASECKVSIIEGDWGDVTLAATQRTGNIYAVLNMANAYGPGGGYLEGCPAQEENMFRRTDCHFSVTDAEMDASKSKYTQDKTDLLNAKHDKVYLDTENPRVCFRGRETNGDGNGYEFLAEDEIFQFYELRAAADDLSYGQLFNPASMRQKIAAQLDTLIKKNIRHVVLSAFGCGAFLNPPSEVARLYREEIAKRTGYFDDIVFAIFYPGYGSKKNFNAFNKEFNKTMHHEHQATSEYKPAVTSSFFMSFMASPRVKYVAGLLLLAGIAAVVVGGVIMAPEAVTMSLNIAGASVIVSSLALATSNMFFTKKAKESAIDNSAHTSKFATSVTN